MQSSTADQGTGTAADIAQTTTTAPLLILGAGGQGKVAGDTAAQAGEQHIVFADDHWPAVQTCSIWPVVGPASLPMLRSHTDRLHIALGDGAQRERFANEALSLGFTLITLKHPSAVVSPHAQIAAGCYLGPLCCVNIDAALGLCAFVNTSASVDHDCRIGAFTHIAPGAHLAGGVQVGTRSWVGLGACVRGGISIGDDVLVGAGAAVVSDVADGLTVTGVPARAVPTSPPRSTAPG